MQKNLEQLAQQVMSLPEDQQLALAHTVLKNAEPAEDSEVAQAWEAEIARRIECLDKGESKTVSLVDALRAVDAKLAG